MRIKNGVVMIDKKLNRGKVIRKYVGEGLKEEGFSYAGYQGGLWTFQKVYKENIIQSIGITVYRFDVWQISFILETNVPGKMTSAREGMNGWK